MKTMLFRHGDVMVKTREGFEIPTDVRPKLKRILVLHKGEQHDHSIKRGVALYAEIENKKYLRVVEPVTLDHLEHGEGVLPAQDYWVEIKKEYDHLEEESGQVID